MSRRPGTRRDRPLSAYVRYELAVYAENVAAGEEVRIADRSAHPELGESTGLRHLRLARP